MTEIVAKLHINMSEGTLSAEGSENFVQSIYSDFRSRLIDEAVKRQKPVTTIPADDSHEALPAPSKAKSKKASKASGSKQNAGRYSPQFDPNLDLAQLPTFYSKFSPKNHSEKILLFAVFMRDSAQKVPCSGNDIYSCYFTLKSQTDIPEAFHQAFITGFNRTGWVQFISKDEVRITTAGENHFTEMSKPKQNDD